MNAENSELHDAAQYIRDGVNHPADRRFTVKVKSDHLRLQFDDDVELAGYGGMWDRINDAGLVTKGINFTAKLVILEPENPEAFGITDDEPEENATFRCVRCGAVIENTTRDQLPPKECAEGSATNPYHGWVEADSDVPNYGE